jgi:ribosomal protein L28
MNISIDHTSIKTYKSVKYNLHKVKRFVDVDNKFKETYQI